MSLYYSKDQTNRSQSSQRCLHLQHSAVNKGPFPCQECDSVNILPSPTNCCLKFHHRLQCLHSKLSLIPSWPLPEWNIREQKQPLLASPPCQSPSILKWADVAGEQGGSASLRGEGKLALLTLGRMEGKGYVTPTCQLFPDVSPNVPDNHG